MSLDGVLKRLETLNNPDLRVFAREVANGTRAFDIMSLDDAWRETVASNPSHLYEVLSGPCEVYLDIEWKCDTKPDNELSVVNQVVSCTKDKLSSLYGVNVSSCLATASGITSDGMYKCSWHVNFKTPGIMWASAKHVGDFVKSNLASFGCVDQSPYNAPKQNWRCVGSSKCSDPSRVLQPKSKKNFLKCIVQQQHIGSTIVGCRASLPPAVSMTGVAQAVLNQFPNARRESAHLVVDNTRFLIVPLLPGFCPIAKRKHRSNNQYAVVDLKCMRWKHNCHNVTCQQHIQVWQPMPQFSDAKVLLPPAAPVVIPVRVSSQTSVPVDLVVRARGPPPVNAFSSEVSIIQCTNGLFRLPPTV